jgi:hypothetical protein
MMHDGRKNMYTLNIKGKRIMLAPMEEKVGTRTKNMKNMLSLTQI